jgi:nicotinamide-nucleotide amidase
MLKLQELFIKKKLTLSLAESCTGGLISSLLTKTAGSSKYFLGSFVVYSNQLKTELLGVDRELIETKTAVDKQVVIQMCRGALKIAKSDYAISVSGYTGPDGENVGTVFGAIGNNRVIYAGKIPNLEGLNREQMQQKSAFYLLLALYHWLEKGEVPFDNK